MEALGLSGVSKLTPARRGCPSFVLRRNAGLEAERGGDIPMLCYCTVDLKYCLLEMMNVESLTKDM